MSDLNPGESVVFKKMLGAFGVGGPSVDTVLSNPNTRPGLPLDGHVSVTGGNHDVEIEHITLALVTRIEVEGGDGEYGTVGEFHRAQVSGARRLAAGEQLTLPFQLAMPWETPITDVNGGRLHGMTMGVRTEMAIARAVDKGDLDPVAVHPLPAQEAILVALAQLGFTFRSADLEYGRIAGVQQTLPFYQEIEFFPPAQYAHSVNELELTFVANPSAVDVILEFDKRGGVFSGGHDSFGRFSVAHTDVETVDWMREVDGWVRQSLDSRSAAGAHGGFGGHGAHHGSHGARGSGAGGMAAGAAVGLVGGMAAAEVVDDLFEGDEGEE
jgi:sporulation-control protein